MGVLADETLRYSVPPSLVSALPPLPGRPLSSAFKQDTRAYVKHDRYELSLDLWRMPSTGTQRPATGIDVWSLMIGMDF